MQSIKTFIFMGRPGSGKGTQAKLLAEKTGYRVLASGRMFREFARDDTPVSRRVKRVLDSGGILPDWIATYLFHREIFEYPEEDGLIIDGFPRRKEEAEKLADTLEWFERPFRVFTLLTKDDTSVTRIEKRFGIEHREDDKNPEVRMREYEENTKPAIEFLEGKGLVIPIDGEQAVEEVHEHVMKHIKEYA
jgi:adenylate kinase